MALSAQGRPVAEFKGISPAQFFYKNKQLAGFQNRVRALYQTIRELVENALDATDTHMILPTIKVDITPDGEDGVFRITVEDNGIGIPPEHIPNAFGRVLYSSKYVLRQTRGTFGLGVKMAVLYAQSETGSPVEVYSTPIGRKRVFHYKIKIDIEKNVPIILEEGSYPSGDARWHGTRVSIRLTGDWGRAKNKIYEYFKRTAIIVPYSEIVFSDPEGNVFYFERATTKLPRPPRVTKPHPHGADIELINDMIKNTKARTIKDFLIKEFQSIGEVTARKILELAGIKPSTPPKSLKTHQIERLVRAFRSFKGIRPPRGDHLSPIGEDIIKIGLKAILKPEYVDAVTRRPAVHEGHAFIVEAGIAYGGAIKSSDTPLLLRYANKIPLLYDETADVSYKVLWKISTSKDRLDWSQYEISFPAPIAVLVHICSTKIPYKGVGKESIADVPEIEREIEAALRHLLRGLKRYLLKKKKEMEESSRAVAIAKYIPDIAQSLAYITKKGDPDEIAKKLLEMLNQRLRNVKIRSIDEVVVKIE